MKKLFTISVFFVLFFSIINTTKSQVYNRCVGQNAIYEEVKDKSTGELQRQPVKTDNYGNAQGNQYDLAVDGAFQGETILVLHLYTGEGFDFSLPQAALKEKGFSVYRYLNAPPTPEEFKKALEKSCQLWIISSSTQMLSAQHIEIIKEYFEQGHGIYIWGDNDPYNADANYVAQALFGGSMKGDYWGSQVVGLKEAKTNSGLVPQHLITTGLQFIFEGVTIAAIQGNQYLKPLIYSSDGKVVSAYYEEGCKRAILDGGFTRLYVSWDAAGTGRYVKNAAAWLVNYEHFHENKRQPIDK